VVIAGGRERQGVVERWRLRRSIYHQAFPIEQQPLSACRLGLAERAKLGTRLAVVGGCIDRRGGNITKVTDDVTGREVIPQSRVDQLIFTFLHLAPGVFRAGHKHAHHGRTRSRRSHSNVVR
jgi:hypothetical protein